MGAEPSIDAAGAGGHRRVRIAQSGLDRAVGAAIAAAETELLKRHVAPTLPNVLNLLAVELQKYAAADTTALGPT